MNYHKWTRHFEQNRLNRVEPGWQSPLNLSEDKRRALAASLAEYQLGDGGGPCRLIAHDAEDRRQAEEAFRRVVDLWFAEEAEHSRLLGGAVTRLRGTFITDTFAFRLFNHCRRLFDAQFEMLVLLLVEIVSTGYYRVVRRHCDDKPIADMCGLILRDEGGHVMFHRDRLAADFPQGPPTAWVALFYALGYACTAFLWLGHGRWLGKLGAHRRELFQHVHHGLRRFIRQLRSGVAADGATAGAGLGVGSSAGQLPPVTPRFSTL
jgi:hypothetical protein